MVVMVVMVVTLFCSCLHSSGYVVFRFYGSKIFFNRFPSERSSFTGFSGGYNAC